MSHIQKKKHVKEKKAGDKKSEMKSPEIGDFVVVEYEGEYFPGNVEDTNGQDYKVGTMCISGVCGWKWPEKPDYCWYKLESIKEIIPAPSLIMNIRGVVQMPEIEKWRLKYA